MFLTCVERVSAASVLVATYSGSESLSGHSTWVDADSETKLSVSDSYTVSTSTLYLRDSDGNFAYCSTNKKYRFYVSVVPALTINAGNSSDCSVSTNLFITYGGTKYYFSGSSCTFVCTGASDGSFSLGCDFDVTVTNRLSGGSWTSNYCFPVMKLNSINISVVELDAEYSSDPSNQEIVDSIGDLNDTAQDTNDTTHSIFDSITDFFGSFFENIINALKSVFIPEDGYFEDFFQRLNDFFAEKLGMLYAPIDMFITFLTEIGDSSGSDTGITFPGVEWEGEYIIEPTTVNLSTFTEEFPELQEKIYFVTDIIMVGAVLLLLQHKLKEVLQN